MSSLRQTTILDVKSVIRVSILSLITACNAFAADFNNVTNQAELRAAVAEADTNQESDVINLRGRVIT